MDRQSPPAIFDRRRVRKNRERSAKRFGEHSFLHNRVLEDIADRLETVKREFPVAVVYGAGDASFLTPACGVGFCLNADISERRLQTSQNRIVFDEELPPLAQNSIDLFVSALTIHTVNDLIGMLAQVRMALKPDGLFVAAAFGEDTLRRLRSALLTAEAEICGGASRRIAPFAAIQDFGQALARAGFNMPVTDVDRVTVNYREPYSVIRDLRGMGETSALIDHAPPLRREVFNRAMEIFAEASSETFDIVYLTGWAPAKGQPKPLKPGSASHSLEAAIKGVR